MNAQVATALSYANEVRQTRKELRLSVRALPYEEGRHRLADILDANPRCLNTLRVEDVLNWVHRMQPGIVRPLLMEADCTVFTTLEGIGDRRRTLLVAALRRWQA